MSRSDPAAPTPPPPLESRWGRLAMGAIMLGWVGCGEPTVEPPPTPAPKPADGPRAETAPVEFAFAPTVEEHLPEGVPHRILLEVGNAGDGTLHIVLASAEEDRAPRLRVEVWTFDQRDKTKLEPHGPPTWFLPLEPPPVAQPTAGPASAELRRALALPNSVVTRPLGVPAESATAFLGELEAAANTASRAENKVGARLDGVAKLFRGLGNDIVLQPDHLGRILELARGNHLGRATVDAASSRRATATADGSKLGLLRTADGWSIATIE